MSNTDSSMYHIATHRSNKIMIMPTLTKMAQHHFSFADMGKFNMCFHKSDLKGESTVLPSLRLTLHCAPLLQVYPTPWRMMAAKGGRYRPHSF